MPANDRSTIHQVGDILQSVFRCERCGGSLAHRVTNWRGHGTGRRGQVTYSPTAWETPSPHVHCICPGGIVWRHLRSLPAGIELRLADAERLWQRDQSQGVPFCVDREWMVMPVENWRQMLQEHWGKFIHHRSGEPW